MGRETHSFGYTGKSIFAPNGVYMLIAFASGRLVCRCILIRVSVANTGGVVVGVPWPWFFIGRRTKMDRLPYDVYDQRDVSGFPTS